MEKEQLQHGAGMRWFAIGVTVVLLFGGGSGFYLMKNHIHNQVITAESKLDPITNSNASKIVQSQDLKAVIHDVEQDVVMIEVNLSDGKALGSGFLYNDKGDIITNGHVVGDVSKVTVKMADSTTYDGTVIGKSGDLDVALVRVPQLAGKKALKMGSTKADVGDEVIAFGAPLGLDNTVTTGIISGVGRTLNIPPYSYKDLYQISAPITHGNSGGPLVNQKTGEVLGINSAGYQGNGNIGFTIPIDQVIPLVTNWSTNSTSIATTSTPKDASSQAAKLVQIDTGTFKTQAIQLVRYFYQNLSSRDYVSAYALMGSEWQEQMSFDSFQKGYSNTMSVGVTEATASEPMENKVTLTAIVEAYEQPASGPEQLSHYQCTYQVGFENGKMRILSGKAEKI